MTADLLAFATDLRQEVLDEAGAAAGDTLLPDAFTALMLQELADAGAVDHGQPCSFNRHAIEASGYGIDDEGVTVELFVTIWNGGHNVSTVGKAELVAAIKRLENFAARALDGLHRRLEESSPAFDMALSIWEARDTVARFRLFVLTDGIVRTEVPWARDIAGVPATLQIWDLERIHRLRSSGADREPVEIDFVGQFGGPLPCLEAPASNPDVRTYLAIVPGRVLADVYAHYGSQLLELNVRSFLQLRGKVNAGIRKTLLEEPGRFLAYNNGIAVTASDIDFQPLPDGGLGIASIRDLQIVNGGQTTATISTVARKDRADLDDVHVQAKITLVRDDLLRQIVPAISRYANSQNKVDAADLLANDPYHVALEKRSRTIWAPAPEGVNRQTRWFYERARGQYAYELARQLTAASRRDFQAAHPTRQKFSKTDLAKFENTWSQQPHVVSLGAQKNFTAFSEELARAHPDGYEPTEADFRHIVARAILFREAEKLVAKLRFGAYRANIVTYTLAALNHATGSRLDLDEIWRLQALPDPVSRAITSIARQVQPVLVAAPGSGNVTEWCKKRQCWDRVCTISFLLPGDLTNHLVGSPSAPAPRKPAGSPAPRTPAPPATPVDDQRLIDEIAAVPAELWFEISRRARDANRLTPTQRSIAYSLGTYVGRGLKPSVKQAAQGKRILELASKYGLMPDSPAPGAAPSKPSPGPRRNSPEEAQIIENIAALSDKFWFELHRWARLRSQLTITQRTLAHTLGESAQYRIRPDIKRAIEAQRILDNAWENGFRHPEITNDR